MISNNDLQLLQKIFFENVDHSIVFDPMGLFTTTSDNDFLYTNSEDHLKQLLEIHTNHNFVVFDYSNNNTDFTSELDNIIGCIHLNNNKKQTTTFQYINNPDKSIRWFFPCTNSHPAFLALYNNSGLKAKAYKAIMHTAYNLGCSSMLISGSFSVSGKNLNLNRFFNGKEIDDYAVFTGTPGENRKTIMALFQKNSCSHFVKIPLTENARRLVQHEKRQLRQLETIHFNHLITPKAEGNSEALCLSNIQPFDPEKSVELNQKHLIALKEIYSKTQDLKHPQQISSWQQIVTGMQFLNTNDSIQSDLPKTKIKAITAQLNILFEEIKETSSFPVALAHGDFTPWNMYEAKDKIHIYDWEMASSDMPLLFDAFHYIFQNAILLEHRSFGNIKMQLEKLSQVPVVKNIMNRYDVDWSKHYEFYLLYTMSYYLPQYIQQKDLHQQAHWLVDCWGEALEEMMTTNKNKDVMSQQMATA